MTISLLARDPATSGFGMVICSSSIAVAARCMNLRSGLGAAASQNVTNPELGSRLLCLLADGRSAQEAIDIVVADESYASYRQLAVVDSVGRTAVFSGSRMLGTHAAAQDSQVVSIGNLLASSQVPQAMVAGYQFSEAPTFEQRLLDGLLAALAAGGEEGPVRSAGLAVVESSAWPVTDLRVDDSDHPFVELSRLLELWLPQKEAYVMRAYSPEKAPRYGVPGDL